jgi:hypothetical protein
MATITTIEQPQTAPILSLRPADQVRQEINKAVEVTLSDITKINREVS